MKFDPPHWFELKEPVTLYEHRHQSKQEFKIGTGLLLKLNNGAIILVGDVNRLGGICDDCVEMQKVVAYSLHLVPLVGGLIEADKARDKT